MRRVVDVSTERGLSGLSAARAGSATVNAATRAIVVEHQVVRFVSISVLRVDDRKGNGSARP